MTVNNEDETTAATAAETETASPPAQEAPGQEEAQEKEPETAAQLHKAMSMSVEDGGKTKSVLAMTKETFRMAHGTVKKTDVMVASVEEALDKIKAMVEKAKTTHTANAMWEFNTSPYEALGKTLDDVFTAFCMWSKVEKNGDEEGADSFNVSKAFRRLQSYAKWMEQNRADLEDATKMTPNSPSIHKAAKVWGMRLTHDFTNRLIWWFDMNFVDATALKEKTISVGDSLRYFTLISHMVMLDAGAQQNHMIYCQSLAKTGFLNIFKIVSMDLGTKVDRLTIGVLPVKMKGIYIFESARWMSILMGIMSAFMSKKIRSRIHVVGKKEDPQAVLDGAVGRDSIPTGFAGLEGSLEKDIIDQEVLVNASPEEASTVASTAEENASTKTEEEAADK